MTLALKSYEQQGGTMPSQRKEALTKLTLARRVARIFVNVEWALVKLRSYTPEAQQVQRCSVVE